MENIAKISYIRQQKQFNETEYFVLDCVNKTLEIYNSSFHRPKIVDLIPIEIEVARDHIIEFVFSWEAYYENKNITDGFKWRFVIENKVQEKIEYCGINELPVNFYKIKDVIYELANIEEEI